MKNLLSKDPTDILVFYASVALNILSIAMCSVLAIIMFQFFKFIVKVAL